MLNVCDASWLPHSPSTCSSKTHTNNKSHPRMSSLSLEGAGRSLLSIYSFFVVPFPRFFFILFYFILRSRCLLYLHERCCVGFGATSLKDHFAETAIVATCASKRFERRVLVFSFAFNNFVCSMPWVFGKKWQRILYIEELCYIQNFKAIWRLLHIFGLRSTTLEVDCRLQRYYKNLYFPVGSVYGPQTVPYL